MLRNGKTLKKNRIPLNPKSIAETDINFYSYTHTHAHNNRVCSKNGGGSAEGALINFVWVN